MSTPDLGSALFLSLARIGEAVNSLTIGLRRLHKDFEIDKYCYIRDYRSGPTAEFYVEVEVPTAAVYCWGVEITFETTAWRLDMSVTKNDLQGDDKGQSTILQFAEIQTQDTSELIAKIDELIDPFCRTALDFDFSSGSPGEQKN